MQFHALCFVPHPMGGNLGAGCKRIQGKETFMAEDNHIGGQPQSLGDLAATASAQAHSGKQPKRKPTNKTGNRFLTGGELAEKAEEIKRIHQDFVVRAGMLLNEVRERTQPGKWGKFCSEAGITRRKADQYIFVACSPIAEKLQGIGIAKALLLARYPDNAKALLKTKSVATMSVKELETKLRGTPTKKKARAVVPANKLEGYPEGFADGQNTDALRAWAAGVLLIRPEALHTPSFLKIARERHGVLRELLGGEYHETLDNAIDTLEQGITEMAAVA
jgi:hypothetical protein